MSLLLTGAIAWPLSSMAKDATGFLRPDRPLGPPLVLVQDDGGEDSAGALGNPDDLADEEDDAEGISEEETGEIVEDLSSGTAFCQSVGDTSFNVDCLSDQFAATAKGMPAKGGYAEARKALLDASARLHSLALANAAADKPAARVKSGQRRSTRPLTAVADPAAVAAKAAAIVQETKLVLLRSSSGSERRRVAYEQVAAVVNSTKVLLRSS